MYTYDPTTLFYVFLNGANENMTAEQVYKLVLSGNDVQCCPVNDTASGYRLASTLGFQCEPNDDSCDCPRGGSCPECKENCQSICLNVRKAQFVYCEKHNVYWFIGSGLSSSWYDETEEIWEKNLAILNAATLVKPWDCPKCTSFKPPAPPTVRSDVNVAAAIRSQLLG